ncbi:hypothetical protein [Halorubellus sp. JP-L1]|uniref:hypothetical protein n=1 Tax=Halorubellus sp. JP-L1 TaxID=2715753 RepID=UPI001878A7D0|nr:hypothetical protein [Halorubellus sp. JP-L1]
MSDSSRSDALDAKHRANRAARLEGVKRWVAYIREQPAAVWGEEQNRVVNAQLESARATDVSPEHERRVTAFGEAMTADADDGDADDGDAADVDADDVAE